MGRHEKQRFQRRGRRKTGLWTILTFAAVLLAVGVLIWGGIGPEKRAQWRDQAASRFTPAPVFETAAPAPTPTPTPAPTPTPWNLVLVNRDNPLPEDWAVEPVELPGGQTVDTRIYAPLMEMFEAARGVNLDMLPNVESGYRSVEKQQSLYDQRFSEFLNQGYSEREARRLTEQWVSRPGTSEHQLGLAVDISGQVYDIYPWLQANSYQYGFILRYPADKTDITGVAGEEWHFRYVGVEAATAMYEQSLCLEEYLERLDYST